MYITKWIAYTNKICLYQHTSICKEQHPCKASQCGSAVNLSNSDYTSYAKASMSTWAVRMRKNIVYCGVCYNMIYKIWWKLAKCQL